MDGWFALFFATGAPVFYLMHRQEEARENEAKTA